MSEIAMHGHGVRGMKRASLMALAGNADPGKFGLMFPHLPPLVANEDALFQLALAMKDTKGDDGDNPKIPAGYTYLGQFVDHDITLDTTPLKQQKADPLATTNFRSPALDLDSLYGDGPGIHPYLYAKDGISLPPGPRFLIGKAHESDGLVAQRIPERPNDLPRNSHGHALIFDERNDENLLVAQFHLLMLKFHNKVVDRIAASKPGLTGLDLFHEARRVVTWHYQWIVLFDFVEKLTEPGLIRRIKQEGRRFYRFRAKPYMPAEFAAAAYRLGHSMVRQSYSHNAVFRTGGITEGTLNLMFNFTGKSGQIVGDLAPDVPPTPLGPLRSLPSNWVIDWRRFFELGTLAQTDPTFTLNLSRRLDPFIVPELHALPGHPPDMTTPQAREFVLPFRNLRRGAQIGLPSGQDVCLAMGFAPLSQANLSDGEDGVVAATHGFHKRTPLWYYILKEAEQLHHGERLGPVGSTIIAETFLGLVHGDDRSFLWQRSNWVPELPGETPGHFTMADLVRFVDDINPVGAG
jgi:hypothetical protein